LKVIVLILDGLGIGEMPDVEEVRPQDQGTNTLKHVLEISSDLSLPNFEKLGMGNLGTFNGIKPNSNPLASYGKCKLAHIGADTYMGHQELMGSKPTELETQTISEVGKSIEADLKKSGYKVTRPLKGKPVLLIANHVIVSDNMEADVGQSFVVTASKDEIPFEETEKIGKVVRETVKVSRVIVGGGKGFTTNDMISAIRETDDTIGIDMAELGIFDDNLSVRHLGFPVNIEKQMPYILTEEGYPVKILGKAADVISCPDADKKVMVNTDDIFTELLSILDNNDIGCFT